MPSRSTRVLAQLREGFGYVAGFSPLRAVLGLLALASLFGMPYTVLLPVVVSRRLHGGADLLGYLMAAAGVGALTGALFLASRRTVLGLGKFIPMASAAFGLGLMAFSRSEHIWLSLLLMFVTGLGMMVHMAVSNTIVQTITDEDKRGRVMSYYMMAFVGMAPFGSLWAGALADVIGAPDTLLVGGAVCVAGALWFLRALPRLRDAVRPIYVRLGILPEMATGINQASQLRVPPEE
jgi:MFS family permease